MQHTQFINIDREIVNWEWYGDTPTMRLYFHLLLLANIAGNRRWQGINVEHGQLITSVLLLRAQTGLSARAVNSALLNISNAGFITVATVGKHLLITVKSIMLPDSAESKSVTEDNPHKETENEDINSIDASSSEACNVQADKDVCSTVAERYVDFSAIVPIYNNVEAATDNEFTPFDTPGGRAPP